MNKEKPNPRHQGDVEAVESVLVEYGVLTLKEVSDKRQKRKNAKKPKNKK